MNLFNEKKIIEKRFSKKQALIGSFSLLFVAIFSVFIIDQIKTFADTTLSDNFAQINADTLKLQQDVQSAKMGNGANNIENSKPMLEVRLGIIRSQLNAYNSAMAQITAQTAGNTSPLVSDISSVSVTPSHAKPGDIVTITANNVSPTANSVSLNSGVYDNYSIYNIPSSQGSLQYKIPQVSSGNYTLYVRTFNAGSYGIAFTVDTPSDISPTVNTSQIGSSYSTSLEAPIGRKNLLIQGSNFTQTGNSINFNGKSVAIVDAFSGSNGNIISYTAPNLPDGIYSVTVSNANGISNSFLFALVNPLKIDSIYPKSGPLKTVVTIKGSGFSINSDNYLEIMTSSGSDVPVHIRSIDGNTLTFPIPYYNIKGNVNIYVYNLIYGLRTGNTRFKGIPFIPFFISKGVAAGVSSLKNSLNSQGRSTQSSNNTLSSPLNSSRSNTSVSSPKNTPIVTVTPSPSSIYSPSYSPSPSSTYSPTYSPYYSPTHSPLYTTSPSYSPSTSPLYSVLPSSSVNSVSPTYSPSPNKMVNPSSSPSAGTSTTQTQQRVPPASSSPSPSGSSVSSANYNSTLANIMESIQEILKAFKLW
jgi:hypothetical protein